MNPVFYPPVAQNVCSTGAEPHPKSRTHLWDIFLRSGVEICIFYIGTLKTWILIRSGMNGWSRRTEQYLDLQAALSRWEHVCSWGQIQQQCSGHSYLPPGSVVNKGLEAATHSSAIAMELVQKNSSEVYEKNCSLFWSNCPHVKFSIPLCSKETVSLTRSRTNVLFHKSMLDVALVFKHIAEAGGVWIRPAKNCQYRRKMEWWFLL